MKSLNESILKSFKKAFLLEDCESMRSKIVAENDEYIVYKIDTPEEAYRFNGLTEWNFCSGTKKEAESYFNLCTREFKDVFYFFVKKNITDPKDEWNYIALERTDHGYDYYYSMTNKEYSLFEIPVNLPKFNKPPLEPWSAEERFIRNGFKKNSNGEFDIDGDFYLGHHKNYLIVDGKLAVKFGKVSGYFDCSECEELTSLEGCPREVGRSFDCCSCKNLTSLEGCPEKVGGKFNCSHCYNLKSLEGCPKEVGGDFYCCDCTNITSLEGCPEKVGGDFIFYYYGSKFTEDDVRSLCDVKGRIKV